MIHCTCDHRRCFGLRCNSASRAIARTTAMAKSTVARTSIVHMARGAAALPALDVTPNIVTDENRWDEKAGLRRDAVGSQDIDVLEAQEINETGNEED